MGSDRLQLFRDGMALVQIALLAILVAQTTKTDDAAPPSLVVESHTPAHDNQTQTTIDSTQLRQLIQQTIRQELHTTTVTSVAAKTTKPKTQPQTAEVVEEQTEEQIYEAAMALQSSNDVIETALLTGYWSRADNKELLTNMAYLNETQRLEIMDKFFTAVNAQQLDLETFPEF